jgi:hypothetical protein
MPCSRPFVRPFRPPWSWTVPVDVNVKPRRSSLYLRSELLYMLPALRGIDSKRNVMLECLERSVHESGSSKQYSGFGSDAIKWRRSPGHELQAPHIFNVYREVDDKMADALNSSTVDSFPIKRLYNLCNIYDSVWNPQSSRRSRGRAAGEPSTVASSDSRGPFPYVDDRATVLNELTKSHIQQLRHRVNSENHPKWALRTIRRRRRKLLIKMKRRSISQQSIRELQAKLIANRSVDKK